MEYGGLDDRSIPLSLNRLVAGSMHDCWVAILIMSR
jgi:hypothetical protein